MRILKVKLISNELLKYRRFAHPCVSKCYLDSLTRLCHNLDHCKRTSRLPHLLDSRLTDGCDVSIAHRPPFIPRKIPDTHFC
jgi:hypothetical protein